MSRLDQDIFLVAAARAHEKKSGLATLCISGGICISMIVERV